MNAKVVKALDTVWCYFLFGVAISFPFGRPFTTRIMMAWISYSLLLFFYKKYKQGIGGEMKTYGSPILILPLIYLVAACFSLTYTADINYGFTEIGKIVSFAFLPITFFVSKPLFTARIFERVLVLYFLSSAICATISLGIGFYLSSSIVEGKFVFRTAVNDFVYQRGDSFFEQQVQGGNYFFGHFISPFMNKNYYAIYLSFAVIVGMYLFYRFRSKRLLIALLIAVVFTIMFFCDSKGALVSFLLACILGSIFVKYKRTRLIVGGAVLIVCSIITYLSPRTSLLLADFHKIVQTVDYESTESTALRIVLWKASIELIKENPTFGVGIGDVTDELAKKTKPMNRHAFDLKLNAHNQYLQSYLAGGIMIFIPLIGMLIVSFKEGLQANNLLLIFFILLFGFNMLFESTLEVFQGIQFFIFFYVLLNLRPPVNESADVV